MPREAGLLRQHVICGSDNVLTRKKNREKFAQVRIWTAWRTSLRARLLESGWRPKPARVARHFEISPSLRQERTWHQIAERHPSDACGSSSSPAIQETGPTLRSQET